MDWKTDYAGKLTTAAEALKVREVGRPRGLRPRLRRARSSWSTRSWRAPPSCAHVEIDHMVAMGKGEYCQARVRRAPSTTTRCSSAPASREAVQGRPRRLHRRSSSARSPSCSARATCRPTWCSARSRRPTSTASARSASRSTTPSRRPRWPRRSSPRSTPRCRAPTATRSSTCREIDYRGRERAADIIELQPPRIGPVEEAIGKHIAGLVERRLVPAARHRRHPRRRAALPAREERPRHPQRDVQRGRRRPLRRGRHHQRAARPCTATRWWRPSSWARAACTTSSTTTRPSTCSRSTIVNDPYVIGQNDNVVAINSAIQVDLMGQVVADTMGAGAVHRHRRPGRLRARRRPQPRRQGDHRPAGHGEEGRASAASSPPIAAGTAVTTMRADVDYVVTEHGVAHLRGHGLRERAEALSRSPTPRSATRSGRRRPRSTGRGRLPRHDRSTKEN